MGSKTRTTGYAVEQNYVPESKKGANDGFPMKTVVKKPSKEDLEAQKSVALAIRERFS